MAEVTQRQRAILLAIVQRYIESGEPVGSGTIAALVGSNVSPATVRNEMVALADAGLLEQPHTSAGRIPTARAFRVFVDGLAQAGPGNARLSAQSRHDIDARFADVAGTQAMLERTSHVLASLSSGVGVAIASMPASDLLEHVHFSRLAPARILAVVVTRGGMVRDRVLALDADLSLTELETAANFLNENYRGWEIERIRTELRLRVESEEREYQRLINSIEQLWTKAVPQSAGLQTIYVEGVANLVGAHPMGGADDRERLREMMSALEAKQRLVNLLNAYIDARQESVRVVFDLEEHAPEMAGLVLIATSARLGSEGERLGTVGVIGPKRMQYERTMQAVGYVAKVLERQGLGL